MFLLRLLYLLLLFLDFFVNLRTKRKMWLSWLYHRKWRKSTQGNNFISKFVIKPSLCINFFLFVFFPPTLFFLPSLHHSPLIMSGRRSAFCADLRKHFSYVGFDLWSFIFGLCIFMLDSCLLSAYPLAICLSDILIPDRAYNTDNWFWSLNPDSWSMIFDLQILPALVPVLLSIALTQAVWIGIYDCKVARNVGWSLIFILLCLLQSLVASNDCNLALL